MTYRTAGPHRPGARSSTSSPVAAAVWEFAVGPLADNPHRVGKQLREPLEGFWSARRGQHRVIYAIDDDA